MSETGFVKGKEVWLPLYEAKMIHHFDHRWATYEGTETKDLYNAREARYVLFFPSKVLGGKK